MEKNTTINYRVNDTIKQLFNDAYSRLSIECSPLTFSKEDFFEALVKKAESITKKDILKVLEEEEVRK